uniref:Uncharacterized protein n=1 Tax=Timema bartmani TaxID=61472 RepID=A0A7R9F1J6_9NEOP|nr:unnamed protein product [Timema bartmani]
MNHTSIRPYYRLPLEVTHAQSESDCPPQASIREQGGRLHPVTHTPDLLAYYRVQTTDESLIIKSESLSHVQTSCRELQTKLLTQTQQTSLTKTQLAEANSTVATMKKQECQLRGEIAEMKRTFGELLVSVEELESKLASKVSANQELEVKIHEQNFPLDIPKSTRPTDDDDDDDDDKNLRLIILTRDAAMLRLRGVAPADGWSLEA